MSTLDDLKKQALELIMKGSQASFKAGGNPFTMAGNAASKYVFDPLLKKVVATPQAKEFGAGFTTPFDQQNVSINAFTPYAIGSFLANSPAGASEKAVVKGAEKLPKVVDAIESAGKAVGKAKKAFKFDPLVNKVVSEVKPPVQGGVPKGVEGFKEAPKGTFKAGNSYADIHQVDPESTITIYRGVKASQNGKLKGGEWVTQDRELARLYSRDRARAGGESAKIISQKVKAKDLIIDPATSPGVTDEFRYNPSTPTTQGVK